MQTERQIQIVDTAIDIISEKGIQGLTIKNIAKEIGISEPAIYRHFESKTAIVLAILNNFEEMASFMNEAIMEMQASAFEKIDFLFSKIVDIFSEEPSHISVVFSEEIFKNDIVLRNKIVSIMEQKALAVENIIKKGQEMSEIRNDVDCKTLAHLVMGSLRFMVKQWDLKDQHQNLKEEGRQLTQGLKQVLKTG